MNPDRLDSAGREVVGEALRTLGPLVADAPVSVDEKMTLRSLAATLSQLAMGCALVRRGDDWVGITSERDVLVALSGDADPDEVWAADVMTEEIVTVEARDRVLDAARKMVEKDVRHVVVVDDCGGNRRDGVDARSARKADRGPRHLLETQVNAARADS